MLTFCSSELNSISLFLSSCIIIIYFFLVFKGNTNPDRLSFSFVPVVYFFQVNYRNKVVYFPVWIFCSIYFFTCYKYLFCVVLCLVSFCVFFQDVIYYIVFYLCLYGVQSSSYFKTLLSTHIYCFDRQEHIVFSFSTQASN